MLGLRLFSGSSPTILGLGFILVVVGLLRLISFVSSAIPANPHTVTVGELYRPTMTVSDSVPCQSRDCTYSMRPLAPLAVLADMMLPPMMLLEPSGGEFFFRWTPPGRYQDFNGEWITVFDKRVNLTDDYRTMFSRFYVRYPSNQDLSDESGSKPNSIWLNVPYMGMILGMTVAEGRFVGIRSPHDAWSGIQLQILDQELRQLDLMTKRNEEEPEPLGPYSRLLYQPVPTQMTLNVPEEAASHIKLGENVSLNLGHATAEPVVIGASTNESLVIKEKIMASDPEHVLIGKVKQKGEVVNGRIGVTLDMEEKAVAKLLVPLFTYMKQMELQAPGSIRVPVRLSLKSLDQTLPGKRHVVPASAVDVTAGGEVQKGTGVVWVMIENMAVPVHVAVVEKVQGANDAQGALWVQELTKPYGLPLLQVHWASLSHMQRQRLRRYRDKPLLDDGQMLILQATPRLAAGAQVRPAGDGSDDKKSL